MLANARDSLKHGCITVTFAMFSHSNSRAMSNAERKFVNLRKRLDQLGYRQPLGTESLPLVEKLFNDLVHTTDSLRNAKLSVGKTEKESRNVDALVEPYRAENARIVRENNDLHQQLLRQKEEKDRETRELKARVRKLDHEANDLKFLNNQYVHKVRCLEKDGKAKSERIQQLQEKNMQAVVQTPGGKKHSIPFRRQRMQIDELIPPAFTSAYPVTQPDDPYVADLLQLADGRSDGRVLVGRVRILLQLAPKLFFCIFRIHELQEDIIKLRLDLENAQEIEYLQETNRTLEEKVKGLQQRKEDVSTEVANLSLKNQELCEELTHIDKLAKRLEMDKDRVLETADTELQEAKKELQRQQKIIGELEDIVTTSQKGLQNIFVMMNPPPPASLTRVLAQSEADFEKELLKEQLLGLKEKNEKMEGVVTLVDEEKVRLQEKVDKAMGAERELVLELESMRTKYGVCGRERSPSRLDAFVRSLEQERDYYRQEAERHRRVRGAASPNLSPSRGRSSWSSIRKGDVPETELLHALTERDELKAALKGLERRLEDVQDTVKSLSTERDHLKMLLKAQEDLRLAKTKDASADLKQAEMTIQQMSAEIEALMEKLKVTQTSALADRQVEERRILDLESAVKSLERERLDQRSEVHLLKERREALEQELKSQSAAALQNAEEVAQERAESNALRILKEQMEQALSDTQHRLSVKTNELHAAHETINKLEDRLGELSQHGSVHKEDLSALQRSIAALDREKDVLQDEVDQKTEKLFELQEENSKKEKVLEDVRLTVKNLESSLLQLQGALNSREREIGSLRRQLDACQEELAALKKEKQVIIKEIKRLQDDLTTMTRENQVVHAEMEDALHERDELKLRVHSYIIEVSKIEKLLPTLSLIRYPSPLQEQENLDLLNRFRMVHSEVEEHEQKLQQAEGLNNSIRLELLSSDTERRQLRDSINNKEKEIQQHIQALQAYEGQLSSLARAMSRLEEELHKAQEDKTSLLSDLASVRELCVKLDSGKELTARQLTTRSMDVERVTAELEDVRAEAELLKKQLAGERLTVRNLESLLSCQSLEHTRDVTQLQGKVSQLETEMDVLRRQLTTERFER
ncbi:hypothetical protein fugu_005746 [Takifugu bimaculatus]|uniref:Centrosomal protein of 135 kDa n=1 Tax=Takifugu bimaculatus TaxID=433685 RepID=A0A4Z2B699_9TELE|nr:hypothetical protein fugu_005746 [Takifugu bimaculatus]